MAEQPPTTTLGELDEDVSELQTAAATMGRVIEDVAAHQALVSGTIKPSPEPTDVRALVRNLVREF